MSLQTSCFLCLDRTTTPSLCCVSCNAGVRSHSAPHSECNYLWTILRVASIDNNLLVLPCLAFQATATGAVQSTRYRSFEAAVDRLIHSPLYTKGATDHR